MSQRGTVSIGQGYIKLPYDNNIFVSKSADLRDTRQRNPFRQSFLSVLATAYQSSSRAKKATGSSWLISELSLCLESKQNTS